MCNNNCNKEEENGSRAKELLKTDLAGKWQQAINRVRENEKQKYLSSRQQALDEAGKLKNETAHDLLTNADKIYKWLTETQP